MMFVVGLLVSLFAREGVLASGDGKVNTVTYLNLETVEEPIGDHSELMRTTPGGDGRIYVFQYYPNSHVVRVYFQPTESENNQLLFHVTILYGTSEQDIKDAIEVFPAGPIDIFKFKRWVPEIYKTKKNPENGHQRIAEKLTTAIKEATEYSMEHFAIFDLGQNGPKELLTKRATDTRYYIFDLYPNSKVVVGMFVTSEQRSPGHGQPLFYIKYSDDASDEDIKELIECSTITDDVDELVFILVNGPVCYRSERVIDNPNQRVVNPIDCKLMKM